MTAIGQAFDGLASEESSGFLQRPLEMCEGGVLEWDEAALEERTFSKTKKFNKCNELFRFMCNRAET